MLGRYPFLKVKKAAEVKKLAIWVSGLCMPLDANVHDKIRGFVAWGLSVHSACVP